MSTLTVYPPAKINLSLKINGKREDGFHELETLVLPLPGLTDELRFEAAGEFTLYCDTPGVPTDQSNLVSRALHLFEKNTGKEARYRITLKKRIPHGAGLGGGSSDAASTFLALNQLTGTSVPLLKLAEWARELGSDIPLFLYESASWCRGKGEIVEPFDLPWSDPILLFKPSFSISTPWAYSRWSNSQEIHGISYASSKVSGIDLYNDLERPVFEKHRFLAELKQFLLDQPETQTSIMSGSGSTIFAVLRDQKDAAPLIERTLKKLDPTLWTHLSIF
ncbi:4-(cytidine 5'-diphospho)-2-C-methyl-D-erythritol kinase [Akkermansiaceae bacterium]|nr:4-(cytidine 5'-diphospho)-2-C-methyl-D-erythritol kinase [Akkermansiaceae bacterium]MDA7911173.1 4-(cytidine 5'-diphospho)-2-C-methyl-D-erythritol kinase [Akkermansiaceae bacterium]MDA7912296.1 4-(cytidine 5'-diphospho)-2-C-methyl-D-erythritol kinase [Akkermansiaceae bacterium]